MTRPAPEQPTARPGGPTRDWLRALERTAPIARHPRRILPVVIEELGDRFGETPALLSDDERLTYRGLAERANRYARWALDQNVGPGDVVGLLMPNRPEYMAVWLGITRVGGVVALLNTHLSGASLAHCIETVSPGHIIVAAEMLDALLSAGPAVAGTSKIWVHGSAGAFPRIDQEIARHPGDPLRAGERRPLGIEDRALLIYTSGTTGMPKAASVSHFRLMQWSHWFAGLMDTRPTDRMYDCLPMYHSVGGVVATGALLVAGGSVVIREGFSARRFWEDVVRWDCTLVQYIGELCRYLVHAEPDPRETQHRIRIWCGNGLRRDVWTAFQSRFRIPRILEFYAATEGNVSLFNVDGTPGSIGRVPPFLAHRFPVSVVRFDVAREEPVRDGQGRCLRCAPGEVGEAIGQILDDASRPSARFEGYTSDAASAQKILRDVFQPGDAWFRTGDLMRQDAQGYFYFVDRCGDTFRWKGENVATAEVADAITAFPGITAATVYGVAVPGTEGRAGMAALVTDGELDLAAFRAHLGARLPAYARPLFLRLRRELDVTATLKYTKHEFVREGFDPTVTDDVVYVDDLARHAFVRVDKPLYDRIQTGQLRF